MAYQFCPYQLKGLQLLVDVRPIAPLSLYMLHFIFSPVATFANILIIGALSKASSMPPNVKQLFLSLAISDLAVGLLAQLMVAVVLKVAASEDSDLEFLCPRILLLCHFLVSLLACTSLLTVTAIAVDRLLAISLHLRYKELVTSKRIKTAIVSVWLTSCVLASVRVLLHNRTNIVAVITVFVGLSLTTLAYIRIYKLARYHENLIQSQFKEQNAQAMDLIREKKYACNVLYFYLIFVSCYVPFLCSVMLLIIDSSRVSFWVAYHVTMFFLLLNSSLNPLVYCWRYREIRQIVKRTMTRVFRYYQT